MLYRHNSCQTALNGDILLCGMATKEKKNPKEKKVKLNVRGKLKAYLQTPLLLGLILALVNVWIYLVNVKAGIILTVFVVIYLVIIICMMIFSRPALSAELVNFATEYGQVQKQLLKELALPHALLDESGRIIWMNRAFEGLGDRERFHKKNITSILPMVKRDCFPGDGETKEMEVKFEDKDFTLQMKRIGLKDLSLIADMNDAEKYEGYLIAVYLFDTTALKLALEEVDNQRLVVGLIYIDNYEETLESVEDVRRSLLAAFIDRQVNQYVNAMDGIVRKTEKDKFLVILRKSALAQAKEDKFRLLEDVKTIEIGNKMTVTLSIGIGVDGLTYAQNCEFARNAIDLALGRGGDQAVVKNRENVAYYGGKSQQKETTARVRARVKAQALEEIISTKDRVFVMGHRNPDMDCFGAAVGIRAACNSLDKKCHIVLGSLTPSLEPLVERYKSDEDYAEDAIINGAKALELADGNTVIIVVDVNRPVITECPDLLRRCRSSVVIDHHRAGKEVIENPTLSYIETMPSSACEMIAELLQYINNGVKYSAAVADCLYAGMVLDTQGFTAKTGVRTFEAAAYLRRSGADVTRVRKMFREDASDYKAKAETVHNMELYRKYYAISVCDAEGLKEPTVVAAQAANDLLNINAVKASFVMVEHQNKIFISGRSIDEVNVQVILEKLGGGGHLNMAGAQLENTNIDAAIIVLKSTLDTMIQEGEL